MNSFKDKIVLITGASGGLGSEFTREFLKEGARIILTDLRREPVEQLLESMGLTEQDIMAIISADLSTREGCGKLFNEAKVLTDHVDVLINNAGIAISGKFAETPNDKWEKVLDINTRAPMRLVENFLPAMQKQGYGHIVNISSVAGHIPASYIATYCASKFAIRAFGLALAGEVKNDGVAVTNVYPWFTRTNLLKSDQFGLSQDYEVPDFILDDPPTVVKQAMQAIRAGEVECFPGLKSQLSTTIQRLTPDLFPFVSRTLIN